MSQAKYVRLDESNGCHMYDPCPLCFNCINKAAHLYARCNTCEVPHDNHDHKKRSFLIRRDNFAITLTKESGEKLFEWVDDQK